MLVLEHLGCSSDGLTLSELARRVDISPSSLLAVLRTLERMGYLQRDRTTRRFHAAPPLFSLGKRTAARLDGPLPDRGAVAEALATLTRALAQAVTGAAGAGVSQEDKGLSPVWLPAAAGPIAPPELRDFLAGPWLASLACVKENGYPHVVPIWYEWDGRLFWVVPRARSEWAAHVRRHPQVSLTVSESEPPLRRVLVEGRAESVEDAARAREVERRMAERYLGGQAAAYARAVERLPRGLFRIVPEKMLSWRGLAPHPRYYQPPAEQDGEEVVNL